MQDDNAVQVDDDDDAMQDADDNNHERDRCQVRTHDNSMEAMGGSC